MSIYIAHYRTVPLMHSATEAGNTEIQIAQIVAESVADN